MRGWSVVVLLASVLPLSQARAETAATTPIMTGRSISCDTVEPVCGIMKDKRLVPFQSECRARAEGAQRVLFGYCSDAD